MLKLLTSPATARAARFAAAALARQQSFVRQAPVIDRTGQAVVIADVHAYKRFGGRDLDMNGSSLLNCSEITGTAVGRWTEVAGCHVLTVTGTPADVRVWLALWDR